MLHITDDHLYKKCILFALGQLTDSNGMSTHLELENLVHLYSNLSSDFLRAFF